MSLGIIEVITLLLGLSGFGLQANPKAPTPDQALRYAMPDADVVAHIDAASLVPGNYKLLGQLADQPQIKASPEVAKLVREAVGEIEGARGIARFATGIDVVADITDATAFVQIVPLAQPSFVLAVHGKFAPANLEKVAATTGGGSPTKVDAGLFVEIGAGEPAVGLTRDGVMLIGTPALVRDRLADGWKPPSHAAGTNLGYAADVLADKPVFAVVLTLSPAARGELVKKLPAGGLAPDLVNRHKLAALSVLHNGLGWTWVDTTAAGLDDVEQMSRGAIDLLRAAQIAPRGTAKIALGAIDSYRGKDPHIDELINHKAELLKLVEAYTGDGNFKATVDKTPRALRLNVRATGRTASEVVPIGLLVPLGVLGYLTERAEAEAAARPVLVEPDRAPIARPATGKPPTDRPPAAKPPTARPPAARPPTDRKP